MTYLGNRPGAKELLGELPSKSVTGPTYNMVSADVASMLIADTTTGVVQINLLPLASVINGGTLYIKKIGGSVNDVTVKANGTELIDNTNTFVFTNDLETMSIQRSAAKWHVFMFTDLSSGTSLKDRIITQEIYTNLFF